MADDPTFYYYPDPSGTLETVSFGEGLSLLVEEWPAEVADAYGGDGTAFRSFLGASGRVRIALERFGPFGTSALERKFINLWRHLQKGRPVGFSREHAKSWASVCNTRPSRGDTVLYTGGNGFTAWSASGAPAEGDEVAIESAWPDAQLELAVVDALTVTPPVHLPIDAPGALYTYGGDTLVRWRHFYPVCRLPQDQVGRPHVTTDRRRTFTLDITLEYHVAATIALFEDEGTKYYFGAPPLRGATLNGSWSVDEILTARRWVDPASVGWRN